MKTEYREWKESEKRELLTMISNGLSFAQIGKRLNRGRDGVEKFTRKTRYELGARNLPHLIKICIQQNLI